MDFEGVRDDLDETTPAHRRRQLLLPLLGIAVLVLVAWQLWQAWYAHRSHSGTRLDVAEQRLDALERRDDGLRDDLRAQGQRLQDNAATNRVLRDEVLGLGQRSTLVEENLAKLADPRRHGAEALRLDEAELLLSLGQQRLQIAGDLDGAKRAYKLADGALNGLDDPTLLNVRQTLEQERDALDQLGAGPHATLAAQLDAIEQALQKLGAAQAQITPQRPAWQRVLAPLVDIRKTDDASLLSARDRAVGEAALHVEFALARAALERDDKPAFADSLHRIDAWLPQLWAQSDALDKQRETLAALRETPLRVDTPLLGSTLQQLRDYRSEARAPIGPSTPAADKSVDSRTDGKESSR